ncbi:MULTISPECIES: type VI secretion system ATPase TssH [Enterobacter]|uniref:Type VI secretion system ATPase TssH n=1 Tax=Enterobacter cloacae TaxID=550 RepID=A0A330GCX6_ENTCL|nr:MULTISPECIES: type VI secretion system ATPase TssH [Enterobacter cloacae complex]MEC5767377.1 type VI secretion system ATPase TssH [Enterobacter chengduensis]NBC77243.1 type VI secretion system ATPase TssH [Enterobacter asburiae]RAZ68952.1 type VI secretion system ATPase TssH [Enterobacter cloacae]HBM9903259.1 type VI secretion system ATPase TssH [Enterobacter chengduensis]
MIRIEIAALVERLHPLVRRALEQAAAVSVNQHATEISVIHLLNELIESPLCDIGFIFDEYGIDAGRAKSLLHVNPLDRTDYPQSYPSFSPLLIEWLQDSWLLASTELNQKELRSGALFLVLLTHRHRYLPVDFCRLIEGIHREQLTAKITQITKDSAENRTTDSPSSATPPVNVGGEGSILARFTTDVTQAARENQLDPVLCRDEEIDLMIDILCRRRKNNPIVVGEAGVGKSALIEGLAIRIVANQVPDQLKGTVLLSLDLGAMQAGASVKGEFEKRFKGIMQEVFDAPMPVILFIDEAHTLIGAGNTQGGLDVSNLLKPALARGELKTIAATTWREYKKYIEKDAALTRRFQLVKVNEPDLVQATTILRGLVARYELAHNVLVDDEALVAAVQLSARYLSGRQLPDKAIDVLDTACARCAINLTAPPREYTQLETRLKETEQEIHHIEREQRIGLNENAERLGELFSLRQRLQIERETLEKQWHSQKALVSEIISLRQSLLKEEASSDTAMQLADREAQLIALQKTQKCLSTHVDKDQISTVIAEWTGVPLQQITQNELKVITELPDFLSRTIKGQDLAIGHLHRHLLTARADLRRTGRPLGAFLLVGPSGVGKTETVLQLTELLFGGNAWLTTINMSEFQEKHTVSRLIGSPPGYVGYGEGGILTEAIRKKPYSVVLLDEVEKAHPDVLNLFYQAFDKGEMADGEGQLIDCKNIAFFLTSNLGYQTIVDMSESPEQIPDVLYPELAAFFKPALLARMEIVPFLPLGSETLVSIIRSKLADLSNKLSTRFNAEIIIDEAVYQEIFDRATRKENGARMLESVIDGALLPPVSMVILQKLAQGETISRIHFGIEASNFTVEVES